MLFVQKLIGLSMIAKLRASMATEVFKYLSWVSWQLWSIWSYLISPATQQGTLSAALAMDCHYSFALTNDMFVFNQEKDRYGYALCCLGARLLDLGLDLALAYFWSIPYPEIITNLLVISCLVNGIEVLLLRSLSLY